MEQSERIQFWSELADGTRPIRDLLGLSEEGVEKAVVLARTAFEAGRFDQASEIFAGLEALEPDHPEHALHRGYAELKAGRREEARACVDRFLANMALREPDRVRGLMFRASMSAPSDRAAAKLDLEEAHRLGQQSPEAMALLEGGAR
jgi:hypothetical protein